MWGTAAQLSQLCLCDLCFLCFFFFLSSLSAEWSRRLFLDLHSLLLLLSLSESFLSLFLFFFIFLSWGDKHERKGSFTWQEKKAKTTTMLKCATVRLQFQFLRSFLIKQPFNTHCHKGIFYLRPVGARKKWLTTKKYSQKVKESWGIGVGAMQLSHIHLLFLLFFVWLLLWFNCGGLLLLLLWLFIVLFRHKSVLQARSWETVFCKVSWK